MPNLARSVLALAAVLAPWWAAPSLALPGAAAPTRAVQDEEPPSGPTDEEVEAAVAALEAALEHGSFEDKVAALEGAALVPHDDVVEAVCEALDDDALEVRTAAVRALGDLRLESARDELHGLAKKKKVMEDEELAVEVLKAIGRHGHRESVAILEKDVIGAPDAVARARIFALGKVRHPDSVEALMGIMNKLRVGKGGGGYKNMSELRIALHVLTGADEGLDRRDWQRWWNDHKRDLEVAAAEPELVPSLGRVWRNFWGEREDRRERRDEGEEEGDGSDDGGEGDGGGDDPPPAG